MKPFLLEDFANHLTFERQLSPNTVNAYKSDVESYLEYCSSIRKISGIICRFFSYKNKSNRVYYRR